MTHISAFLDYLNLEKNYSQHTVTAYERDLRDFQDFLSTDQSVPIEEVRYEDIREWIISMVHKEISNRTINRKISSLNSFYKFLQKTKGISINPLQKHKALKTKKSVQLPFSSSELNQVLNKLSESKDFISVRDRFIVELFYGTGMRRIELVNLKLSDVDAAEQYVKVVGKRNKERLIPLIPSIVKSLKHYLELRSTVLQSDSEALFITEKGAKIYEMLVYRIINKYFSEASSKLKCSPHVLRHSFATHLLNEGADINSVKELLGHASLGATQIYTHNSISELKKAYLKSHPRNR